MQKTVAVLCLALTAACSHAITEPKDVRVDSQVELLVGESARVENSAVTVSFTSVNDSRCPTDVVCVTAGDAPVQLTFSGAGAERTDTLYFMRAPRSVVYGDFSFEMISVLPLPKSTEPGVAKTLKLRVTRAVNGV